MQLGCERDGRSGDRQRQRSTLQFTSTAAGWGVSVGLVRNGQDLSLGHRSSNEECEVCEEGKADTGLCGQRAAGARREHW